MEAELLKSFSQPANEFLEMISTMNGEQLNHIPFEGSWTAAQVGDHVLKSFGIAKILNGKTVPAKEINPEKIKGIQKRFLDFSIKMKSPEFILPSSGVIDKVVLEEQLEKKITYIIEFIKENSNLSNTCLDMTLPGSEPMTQLEWIQFLTVHTQRHLHQLKNIQEKVKIDGLKSNIIG